MHKAYVAFHANCSLFLAEDVVGASAKPDPILLQCPTNAEAKRQAVHFTDKARITCSFGFEDLMIVVTM